MTSPIRPANKGEPVIAGSRVARLGDRLLATILDSILVLGGGAWIGMWAASKWVVFTEMDSPWKGQRLSDVPADIAFGVLLLLAS